MNPLVTANWLFSHMSEPDVHIVDASWYLPTDPRNPFYEYGHQHIEGAHFFDIDEISDKSSKLPHMMPNAKQFAAAVGAMGISDKDTVVVYDSEGLFSAARVWWMFRAMGHENVFVLDGGLPKWKSEGHLVTSKETPPGIGNYSAKLNPSYFCSVEEIKTASQSNLVEIADARAPGRFRGETAEPRAGLRAGHIPNSKNVFFKELLTKSGEMKSPNELVAIFVENGVDLNQPIITTCGSGITAAVLSLALAVIGHKNNSLYDGSWTEYGARQDLEIETG